MIDPLVRRWRRRRSDPAVPALVGASLVLLGCGIWWGVPAFWAPDELTPFLVHNAINHRFSVGWWESYPPVLFYLLTPVFVPVRAAAEAGLVELYSPTTMGLLQLLSRATVLVMAIGTVLTVYVLGRDQWDRRSGVFAALVGMSVLPFVFYAKLANVEVPYVFWALLAIVFYGRIAREPRPSHYWWLATFATLAVCTKDQAYAFFPLPALHVLWLSWRSERRGPLMAALAGAAAWAAVLFALCHNLFFNFGGFMGHLGMILGPASDQRMFDPGPAGQLALAGNSLVAVASSMNWVGVFAALAGILLVTREDTRRRHLWLLLPIASYYLSLIAVIGYYFDRFFIGVCLLLSLFAGRWLASLWVRGTPTRAAAVLLVAFSIARGGSINLLMLNDSRLTVEAWVQDRVADDRSIALVGWGSYLPRIAHPGARYYRDVPFRPSSPPDYIIVNAEYMQRFEAGSPTAEWYTAVRTGRSGYARALAAKSRVPLAIVGYERMFRDTVEEGRSNLDKVNPRIEVYQRFR